jgi:hypothetical protein
VSPPNNGIELRRCGAIDRIANQGRPMPNGKIGDHPYTDIVIHGRSVYSDKADTLIREIDALSDDRTRRELADRLMSEFNEYLEPNIRKLERELTEMRDRLTREARQRGFET